MDEHIGRDARETRESIDWWESGPVFSTVEHGPRVTRLRPEFASNLRVWDFVVAACVVACCAALAVVGIAALVSSAKPWGYWWLALAIPSALAAGCVPFGMMFLGASRYGRGGIAGALGLAGVLLGLGIGCAVNALLPWLAGVLAGAGLDAGAGANPGSMSEETMPEGSETMPNPVLLGFAAALALAAGIVAATVPGALRAARRGAARILRLRAHGAMYAGEVAALPDPRRWRGRGEIPIRYRDDAGERRIAATLHAASFRVPMPGTRLLVFVGSPAGAPPEPREVHIELDPECVPEFDPHTARYEAQSPGGSM
ncbi:hypothetical protein MUN77_09590 [Leucobacter allii]|uniref:hypothetical protein n=1 Tax=Leucobacter allii TaxID=2932247 RepID=UPI001FD2EBAF|nr:hypothetical protein [Leucobacter allii]UOR00422.1 hypothetical protein MUN77_09590 [Leucobacter allii]